jgi:hypothetical protein
MACCRWRRFAVLPFLRSFFFSGSLNKGDDTPGLHVVESRSSLGDYPFAQGDDQHAPDPGPDPVATIAPARGPLTMQRGRGGAFSGAVRTRSVEGWVASPRRSMVQRDGIVALAWALG